MPDSKKCLQKTCGAIHPKIVKDNEDQFTFYIETIDNRSQKKLDKLYPDTIRAILERISDATVDFMGVKTPPSKLMLRIISVPPTTIRPGVKNFGNNVHDTTNLLQHIVKRNNLLPKQLPDNMGPSGPGGAVDNDLDRSIQNLQQIYYELIRGSSATSQGSSGKRGLVIGSRSTNSILKNIPGKDGGRIRSNLLGGRTFYMSRSTISGNMKFKISEVGIPLEFARTMQVKEVVQEFNREWLMPFFLNGRKQYPGSTYVDRRATGETHDVSGMKDYYLEVGDSLLRDVVSKDLAFFNRQPTLERSSMGGHSAVIMQDPSMHTFQINVITCEWYNADFDGDQMNLWVPRSPSSRAEALIMSNVANWFISSKNSGPVNGEVQDSTVGCYELTRSTVLMDKFHAMCLFGSTGLEAPRFDLDPPDKKYTGRDIVSMLLSEMPVNYSRAPTSYSDVYAPYISYDKDEIFTVIEQGKLIKGVLDKKAIGAKSSGGIFHLISREYGPQQSLNMIYALQQVSLQFLLWQGFTVGTADLIPKKDALEQIHALISSVILESQVITDRLLRGEIVPPIDSNVHDFYEKLQINALKIPETEILRWILGSINPNTNGFFKMIASGSKGSNPNLIHVSGAIGQTTINGQRIQEKFAFRRTLPYYARFSIDPAAYGFVANSYVTGMTVGEFIFQDMNGRFDLINKALSTASTGTFMRKGIMNTQSCIVDNHLHVSKDTKIVQMIYGEDGIDPRELEKVDFNTIKVTDTELRSMTWVDVSKVITVTSTQEEIIKAQESVDNMCSIIKADRDKYRKIFLRLEALNSSSITNNALLPVNTKRIIDKVFVEIKNNNRSNNINKLVSAPDIIYKINKIINLCNNLPYTLINEIQERRQSPIHLHKKAATFLLCLSIRSELNPKILVQLTNNQLDYIIEDIRLRYGKSLIEYGTAVGILAAQAISEPLTQYMLDSHHRSVGGGTNKSGLVRVNEIYGAKDVSVEQSSVMTLPLYPHIVKTIEEAQDIVNSIEYVTLSRFVKQYDILLEPHNRLIFPLYIKDIEWIEEFLKAYPQISPSGDLTNWCFRFVIDKSALVLKAVELELIVIKLRNTHPGVFVIHTSEAAPEIIIRVWHRASQFRKGGEDEPHARELLEEVLNTPIRGIKNVLRAAAEKTTYMAITDDNGLKQAERCVITTTGTNLYHAMLHQNIDKTQASSTSVDETFRTFGIEAARAKIISETRAFMEDSTPNLRHLYLYADEMTRTGKVTSVEGAGLGSREPGNIFLRMSAGSPIQVITSAALNTVKSKIYGIAAPQLLGGIPQIGTLYNSVIVDEEYVRANIKSVDNVLDEL